MKHSREDYNRIQDPKNLIPEDEPVFLLRGQDQLAPSCLAFWAKELISLGGDKKMAGMAIDQATLMRKWQSEHGFRLPDLPSQEEITLQGIAEVLGRYKSSEKASSGCGVFPSPGTGNFEKMKQEILEVIDNLGL